MASPVQKISVTGIKPTGEPHLGNYIGAIRPALDLASEYQAMYFIADYHALTTLRDPELLRHYTRSVAASWIAAGLDPERTLIYRQSDVPETFELNWVMSCLTGKGLMNGHTPTRPPATATRKRAGPTSMRASTWGCSTTRC